MGKPTSKIVETLVMIHQPVRYVVTNTERIMLVTHDYKYANRVAEAIQSLTNPKEFYLKIPTK